MPQIVMFKPGNCYPPLQDHVEIGFDRLRLKPGTNHLSDAEFAALSNHPDYPSYAARKALVVHSTQELVDVIPLSEVPADLSAYNVEEAGDIIDGTHDLDVLKRWYSADARVTVKKAITQRTKDLGGNP
jgi:uncharacterized protein YifN (PemK superfamily)